MKKMKINDEESRRLRENTFRAPEDMCLNFFMILRESVFTIVSPKVLSGTWLARRYGQQFWHAVAPYAWCGQLLLQGCSCLLGVAIRLLASLTLITVTFPMALTVPLMGSSDLRFKLF
ncbi:hypothetical protein BRARA_B01677 [Brassica rapa]|uniref:Uncharacterized protein n=1 Tax=Brassica campestris TaxID=3711 RepID=A0A398AAT9_BRACM|nr:hypothetical protein BRARA_B01677 [Brassica rapa]